MREIKFRGKRIDNGQWVCGQLRFYDNDFCEIMESGEKRQTCHVDGKPFYQSFAKVYEVDPATVGQYTGLKDRNGVEIFEGDIIRIDGMGVGVVDYEEGRFAMHRKEERFCWPVYCRIDHSPFVPEIIGNIHDNPELLEGGRM